MPSRKRAKGKARKAKARESNCNLILHNESVCRHGCEVISKDDVCYKFVEQLEVEMNAAYDAQGSSYLNYMFFSDTVERMKAVKEYRMIWDSDDETQQKLQSLFTNLCTNLLLRDDEQRSIKLARAATVFCIASSHDFNYWKAMDLSRDRVTLRNIEDDLVYDSAKFFHRRIPCKCLKKIYLRERTAPRMSVCSFCDSSKERSQLYLCSSCLYNHYCGVECQASHWSEHKPACKGYNPRNDCGL